MNKLITKGNNSKGKVRLRFRLDDSFERKIIRIVNKPDVNVLDDEKVMVDFNSGKYFVVKGAGNDIWDLIFDGVKVGYIIKHLLDRYEVEKKQCVRQTAVFLSQLMDYGFITVY